MRSFVPMKRAKGFLCVSSFTSVYGILSPRCTDNSISPVCMGGNTLIPKAFSKLIIQNYRIEKTNKESPTSFVTMQETPRRLS